MLVYQLIRTPILEAVHAVATISLNIVQFILHVHLSLHHLQPSALSVQTYIYIYIYICVCVCVTYTILEL